MHGEKPETASLGRTTKMLARPCAPWVHRLGAWFDRTVDRWLAWFLVGMGATGAVLTLGLWVLHTLGRA